MDSSLEAVGTHTHTHSHTHTVVTQSHACHTFLALLFQVVDSFRFYSGGVYEGDCLGDLNHAMTLVGWWVGCVCVGGWCVCDCVYDCV